MLKARGDNKGNISLGRLIAYRKLAVAGGLLLASVLGEIATRLISPQLDAERWFQSNERYGYTLKSNFHQLYHYPKDDIKIDVRTNSLGLRDREYDLSRKNVKRVLLLGDSFTFGEGLDVEENFDNKLEALLNTIEEQYYVINTGVGGWGTIQQTRYAKDHFQLFDPSFIILTFCGNDPSDDARFRSDEQVDHEKGRFYFPGKIFIRNHSHLYRFIYKRVKTIEHYWQQEAKLRKNPKLRMDSQSSTVISETEWKSTISVIYEFHKEYLDYNPDGILLIQATYPLNEDIRDHLRSISNDKDLIYVDLYEEASQVGADQIRLPYDGHWTPQMHKISAKALLEVIRDLRVDRD
jgi:lysophospholipase L1-like esterase